MYVNVVPAIRSIRGVNVFTYQTAEVVSVGQVVRIPWRNKSVVGVVWEVNVVQPSFVTKALITTTDHILSAHYLDWLKWFAQYYFISLSHAVKIALPAILQRPREVVQQIISQPDSPIRVSKARVALIGTLVNTVVAQQIGSSSTVVYNRWQELVALLHGILKHGLRVAVIVPEEYMIEDWQAYLAQYEPLTLSAKVNGSHMYAVWCAIQQKSVKLVIGTKRLSVFPLDQCDMVIVIDPEHPAHKQWDMNPRYQVWRVTQQLAQNSKTRWLGCSQTPPADYISRTKLFTELVDTIPGPDIRIIDMSTEPYSESLGVLSTAVIEHCKQAAVPFLWFNKKGEGSFMVCRDCGALTDDLTSVQCKKCTSSRLSTHGFGTTTVRNVLQTHFPDRPVIELTADTEAITIPYQERPIIVGTSFAHKIVQWQYVDYIATLLVDHQLSLPDFRSTETVLHELGRLRSYRQQLDIQTYAPLHPLFVSLQQWYPEQWYRQELALREQLKFPPFAERIEIRNPVTNEQRFVHSITDIPNDSHWIIDREL